MKFRKYIAVFAFAFIILLPFCVSFLYSSTGKNLDTELKGYTDEVAKPEFTVSGFLSGEFQSQYTSWLDQNVGLHASMTKTYNSIQYEAFNVGNRPIGKDGFIFEPAYLNSELNIGPENDFSIESNRVALQEYVDNLVTLNEKLQANGKYLYVYIAPSKADFYQDKSPEGYMAISNLQDDNVADLFVTMLSNTDVKYLRCSDLKDELTYPPFYYTGIHWSRTYEQYASNRILNDLRELTGNNYRTLNFTGVQESTTPFNRDTDVYDMLNVWKEPDLTFYQYDYEKVIPENYDTLGVMMYGDSFAQGLRSDVFDAYPDDSLYYVNYDNYILDYKNYVTINHDYNNIDWQTCLDKSDIIIIEMTECLIGDYSKGFVPYLINYLDTYVPGEPTYSMMASVDVTSGNWDATELNGIYGNEGAFAWTSKNYSLKLQDTNITSNGLQFDFTIPESVMGNGEDVISIYVNGSLAGEYTYDAAGTKSITIPATDLTLSDDGVYSIYVSCSNWFNPKDLGATDDRILAMQITYIGAQR